MGLTFVSRKYTCNHCGHTDKAFTVISKISDIISYCPTESRPEGLKESSLYIQKVDRVSDDLPAILSVVLYPCDKCSSTDLTGDSVENYTEVSNFYPKGESIKWFEGFAKHA